MTVRGYRPAVDWSRSGLFTGTLEDVSSYVTDDDVEISWGRGGPRALENSTAGRMPIALNNMDRQFSPENTSSPIAGKVLKGTSVRFDVTDPATAGITTLIRGPIDSFEADPSAAELKFIAQVSDGWGQPGDTKLSTPVYQGRRTGDLITIILDLIGWPADRRSIDSGATLVPYWWLEGTDAATAVTDLVQSEGTPAIAYVAGGVFTFRDRHHRIMDANATTSQGTYTHTIPAGAVGGDHPVLADTFSYDHGQNHIVNTATLDVTPRVPRGLEVVWESTDPILLAANEVVTLTIRTDDPFISLETPDDAPGDYSLAFGAVTPSLSRTSGQSALLTLTAGGAGVFLETGIRVRGVPLGQGAARKFEAIDQGSINTFGLSDWDKSAPWAYYYDADAIVGNVVADFAGARPSVTFEVDGILSAATFTRNLATAVSDRITVRNDVLGLNAAFHIEQVTHIVQQLGLRHRVKIGAQLAAPAQASTPFTFDTATPLTHGFDHGQFALSAGTDAATMFLFDSSSGSTQGFGAGKFAS
jgi:hypothetical protein